MADSAGSFEKARELTRFHYQWLVLNEYLPAICAGEVAYEVLAIGAPLYAGLHDAHPSADPAQMPIPLEFSIAAFRFGHAMMRGGYDHDGFFGPAAAGADQLLPFASFQHLFEFTGNGRMP